MNEQNLYTTPQANLNTNKEVYYDPKIFSWSGRIGRLRYFVYGMLMYLAMAFIFAIVSSILTPTEDLMGVYVTISMVVYLAFIIFALSLAKRRLNDIDASGWFCLLFIVPIANLILGLVLLFMPGSKTANKYGPMPSKNNSGMLVGGAIASVVIIGILLAIAIPSYQQYVKRAQQQAEQMSNQQTR